MRKSSIRPPGRTRITRSTPHLGRHADPSSSRRLSSATGPRPAGGPPPTPTLPRSADEPDPSLARSGGTPSSFESAASQWDSNLTVSWPSARSTGSGVGRPSQTQVVDGSSVDVPEGWATVAGTVVPVRAANALASVTESLSLSYEDERRRAFDARQSGVQPRMNDERPGRETLDGLQTNPTAPRVASLNLGPSVPSPPRSLAARDPQPHRPLGMWQPSKRDNLRAVLSSVEDEAALAAAKTELDTVAKERAHEANAKARWKPFRVDRSSAPRPALARPSVADSLPVWARPTKMEIGPSRLRASQTSLWVSPPTDAITTLPTLPWETPVEELSVAPRPASYLNAIKPLEKLAWVVDVEHTEYRSLETNLTHLSQLHPALIDQRSIVSLLDQYLPLSDFHGQRRQHTLERMFKLGLRPTRTLFCKLVEGWLRYRCVAAHQETELEAMTAQLEAAGMKAETTEQQIETLALVERGYLTVGYQIGANAVKEKLYALTPSPPRPTDLLLAHQFPTDHRGVDIGRPKLHDVLAFVRELVRSGQPVPDRAIALLVRVMPLDPTTLDGFLEAAEWVQEETSQPLGTSFWAAVFHRAFRKTRDHTGDRHTRVRTPLRVLLDLFHRLESPSTTSVLAGIDILDGLKTYTADGDARLDAVKTVYGTLLPQLDPAQRAPPIETSIARPSQAVGVDHLRRLFDVTFGALFSNEMPLTLAVASFAAKVQADQERLLPGHDNWHDQVLSPLLDPPYPMKPSQIAATYAILVDAFPSRMRPVDIYWRFLRKTAVTVHAEPVETTHAALSVLKKRLASGEAAHAGKTLVELVETLKEEIRAGGWDRRGTRARQGTSLDRDPRRAVLSVVSVTLRLEHGLLPAALWNVLVEATASVPLAQDAVWKVLADVHPSEINVRAAISRLRLVGDLGDADVLAWSWAALNDGSPAIAGALPVVGAWLEGLMRTRQYGRLAEEIVRVSDSSGRTDEMLDWASQGIRLASTEGISTDTSAVEKAVATLEAAFGNRWARTNRNSVEGGLLAKPDPNVSSSLPAVLQHPSKPAQVAPSGPRKSPNVTRNLPAEQRRPLILQALADRGVRSNHAAHDDLVSTLIQLGNFSLPRGKSYAAVRALFHPVKPNDPVDVIPQVSIDHHRQLINLHLDILNVHPPPPEIATMVATRQDLSALDEIRRQKDELGLFGFRRSAPPPLKKPTPESDAELAAQMKGREVMLDFEIPDIKW